MPDDSTPVDVVRARRFELVDNAGRIRAVLAVSPSLDPDQPDDEMAGLELFGSNGSSRGWFLDSGVHGVQLAFEIGGNQVLMVEAVGSTTQRDGRAAITMCDRDGAPVLCCDVDADGRFSIDVRQ